MSDGFIRIGALLNLVAGIALPAYWYAFALFMPYRELSSGLALLVKNRNWSWINSLGVLGALAGVLGQAAIFVVQAPSADAFATVGFYTAAAGTILVIGTMLWETVLWPILVGHDESLLDFRGPIYASRTFIPFFIASGVVFAAGYVLVGIGIARAGVLPAASGTLLAIGGPAFALGSLFGKAQVYPRSLGVTLMSAALIWLGLAMLSGAAAGNA